MTSKFALPLPKQLPKPLTLGVTILVGAGAIAYLNFAQRAPKSLPPAGTQLVPQTALAAITLTTDELTWTKLRQFGTADSQQQFDTVLSGWKDRLFTANGYSFKRDIQPWIGDRITLALLPTPSSQQSSSGDNLNSGGLNGGGLEAAAQNLILIVPIADAPKARDLLAQGSPKADVNWESRSYKGIDIQTITTPDGQGLESAVIGTNWLLLSNTATAIEQAIDTHKGGKSLLDIAGYRKATTRAQSPQPPGKNFAQLYLNIPLANQLLETPPDTTTTVQSGSILPLQGSQGIIATALIEPEGVRFKGTSWLLPKNDLAYSNLSNEAGEMPRRLPDDTLVMMSGSNLQQFWRAFSESNSSPPFFPNPQNLKAGLLTQTGLDIDEDVMPWAAGEFALALLPPVGDDKTAAAREKEKNANEAAPAPPTPADTEAAVPTTHSAPLMLMVQTNDRSTAESVWAQLDEVMISRYRFQVETDEFEGGTVTRWISPFQGLQFSHGWLPGNVTFFAVGEGAADTVAPKPEQSLAENSLFQTLTTAAPKPNNGHFYLDLAQINALGSSVFPLPQLSTSEASSAIQAVGLTTTLGDGQAKLGAYDTMEYELYIKLAKGGRPGSL
ncbi:MAG: DUF3352 domain-containing protein [Phormidesmis sp. RL_2_1]|nr:DUF3352 domain-containing protein [Phormidesmis sp. RL_2_1]